METRCWVLLTFALAVAATVSPPPPLPEELSYAEAVSLALDLYNRELEGGRAFRLLGAKPQPEWDPSGRSLQELEFTVQETTCPPSEKLDLDACSFKDDGVVKECSGTIFLEQGVPVIQYRCETVGQHIRVRRGIGKKIKKKLKKIKNKVKKGINKFLTGGNSPIVHGGGRRHLA